MQRAIVPYQPPGCSTRAGHQRSFASFVRNGGRVNPVTFGATPDDGEAPDGLITDKKEASEAIQIIRATQRSQKVMQFAVIVSLIFAISVFGGLGVVVWRVNENMQSVEAAIRPHASHMINETLNMMSDMGSSFHNMHEVSDYTAELASTAGGTTGTVTQSLNSTAVITARLAAFLAHPTLKLSLGDS